jgi:hypothetical protein
MVQAILKNEKTMTRRIIKPQPQPCNHQKYKDAEWRDIPTNFVCDESGNWYCSICGNGMELAKTISGVKGIRSYYNIGDILWVRETWAVHWLPDGFSKDRYVYKADGIPSIGYYGNDKQNKSDVWIPSIHMPKNVARLFLKETNLEMGRLQDITEKDAIMEGCPGNKNETPVQQFSSLWNKIYSFPTSIRQNGNVTHYESYPWEDIQEIKEYRGLPWKVCGNPLVWVNKFEIDKVIM